MSAVEKIDLLWLHSRCFLGAAGVNAACRDCQAEVIFLPSAKTGKPMILDAEPKKGVVVGHSVSQGDRCGTFVVEAVSSGLGHFLLAHPGIEAQPAARVVDVYTDHHATCPKAADWKGQTRATRKGSA